MKKDVFNEGRQGKVLSLIELLASAGAAGIPAGKSLTCPQIWNFTFPPFPTLLLDISALSMSL